MSHVPTTSPLSHRHPVTILNVSCTYHPSPTGTPSPSLMSRVPTTPPLPRRHPVTILDVSCTYHPSPTGTPSPSSMSRVPTIPPLPHRHPVTILNVSCTYHPSPPPPAPCHHPQCLMYLPPLPSPTGTPSPSSMSRVPTTPPLPHRHPVTILNVSCTYQPSPPLPSPTSTPSPSSMSRVPTTPPLPHRHPVTILDVSCTYHPSPPLPHRHPITILNVSCTYHHCAANNGVGSCQGNHFVCDVYRGFTISPGCHIAQVPHVPVDKQNRMPLTPPLQSHIFSTFEIIAIKWLILTAMALKIKQLFNCICFNCFASPPPTLG